VVYWVHFSMQEAREVGLTVTCKRKRTNFKCSFILTCYRVVVEEHNVVEEYRAKLAVSGSFHIETPNPYTGHIHLM